MKLEKQVTSLKLSKKLKKLGVEQESLWLWDTQPDNKGGIRGLRRWTDESISHPNQFVPAFTVAELGEMLPLRFETKRTYYQIHISHWLNGWVIEYKSPKQFSKYYRRADTEANARAKMLIYLIENKLIKGTHIKGRKRDG